MSPFGALAPAPWWPGSAWQAGRQRGPCWGGRGSAARWARAARRTPRRFKSSHNAALASQFRYKVSARAGEPARSGRGSRRAEAVTRAPGRGWRPRAAFLALSARDPAKGRSRLAARPGPQPGPQARDTGRGSEPAANSATRARSAPRTAPAARLLAESRSPVRGSGSRVEAAPAGGATAARALAGSRSPARGVLSHLAPGGEVRREGAPGSRGLPAVRGARPAEGRRQARGAVWPGTGAGRPPGSERRRVPTAPAGPSRRPAGAAQLRN